MGMSLQLVIQILVGRENLVQLVIQILVGRENLVQQPKALTLPGRKRRRGRRMKPS